jgi:ferredoxin-NADP reductase
MNLHTPFAARLIAVSDVADKTRLFRFRIEGAQPDSFSPGQFFLLQVDEKTNRAYSIASAPTQLPEFELLVKYVDNGAASTFLWHLKEGSEVLFRGPMGRFGIRHPHKKQLLIATGTGLAPMRSFYQSLIVDPRLPALRLIFGVRHEENLFCLDELRALKAQYPERFSYTLCLSQPHQAVTQDVFSGRVTGCLASAISAADLADTEVSLCGSREMVDEAKGLLEAKGVPKELINVESW